MSSMNINLTPYLKQWVEGKVKKGLYNNVSEVMRDALRLLEYNDRVRDAKLRDLQGLIREGVNSGSPEPWNTYDIKKKGRALLAKG